MRGEKELECLNLVRDECTFKDCYGMNNDDWKLLQKELIDAKEGEDNNKFPDFIFENGFIEHFQVTSSKVTKNGAKHIKELNEYHKETNKKFEQFKNNCIENPLTSQGYSVQTEMHFPNHCYDYLKQSIVKNFENHIKSLERYDGSKDIGIFLVEYSDDAIAMNVTNMTEEIIKKVNVGKIKRKIVGYNPSYDREMLKYLYTFKDKLKYIIWVNHSFRRNEKAKGLATLHLYPYYDISMIKIENIPSILQNMTIDYSIDSIEGCLVSKCSHVYSLKETL